MKNTATIGVGEMTDQKICLDFAKFISLLVVVKTGNKIDYDINLLKNSVFKYFENMNIPTNNLSNVFSTFPTVNLELFKNFRKDIYTVLKEFRARNIGFTNIERQIVDRSLTFLNRDGISISSLKFLIKNISSLKDERLSKNFTFADYNLDILQNELNIIKTYTEGAMVFMNTEMQQLREFYGDTDEYKAYVKAFNTVKNKVKEDINVFLKKNGTFINNEIDGNTYHIMKISEIKNSFADTDYVYFLPHDSLNDFYLDEMYQLITFHENEYHYVVSPNGVNYVPLCNVKYSLNTNFHKMKKNNPCYLQYVSNVNTIMSLYLQKFKKNNLNKKSNNVLTGEENFNQIMNVFHTSLTSNDNRDRMISTIMTILIYTASRIGTFGNNTNGVPTFGISTLQRRHITIENDKIILSYQGKKGMNQVSEFRRDMCPSHFDNVKNNITEYYNKTTNPNDYVFNSKTYGFSSNPVFSNNFFKQFMKKYGIDNNTHDFRNIMGNKLFNDLIKQEEFNNQKEIYNEYKRIMTQVGIKLGHMRTTKDGGEVPVWQTAARSYVSADYTKQYFDMHKFMMPNTLEKMITIKL